MRSFRRLASRWPISVLCVTVLVAPILGTALTPQAVSAQSNIIGVAVVDFRNTSGMSNEMFGTMATDAVVVELLRSGKFSVTTSDDLQAGMERLGYKAKGERTLKLSLTPSMMTRLGQEVESGSVVTGEVSSIKVDKGKKRAEVRVAVRMLDCASGEWCNGAIATGTSNPRIGYTADKDTDWVIEAINNAARKAVETMTQYIIPEATIVGTVGTSEVLLNRGSQDGMEIGMEMIVLRRGDGGLDEVVGRVRITKTTDTDSRATVVQGIRGVKPEDRVRAVYDLPKDTGKTDTQAPKKDSKTKLAKGTKLLLGLIALIGIATLFGGGGDKGEEVPGALVMAGKSPDITSHWDDGGILVVWNTPKEVNHSNIMQYHIWRDTKGQIAPIGGGGGSDIGPVMANDEITATPYSGPAGSFDHGVVDDINGATFDYQHADTDTHELSDSNMAAPGITPGKTHQYWISCLYKRPSTSSAQEDPTYWETGSVYAGRATYIIRPELVIPGGAGSTDYEDLSNITFQWKGSRGADQYVIEVSPTPTFERSKTWVGQVYNPVNQDGTTITKSFTDVLSVCPEFANLAPGSVLYWRVGGRNSQDSPGPYPAGPTPANGGAKSTRYIYSDPNQVFSFMTLGDEPPPPGGGGDDSSDDDDNPPPPPNT